MVTCPSGHESASDDFCDMCGIRIGGTGSMTAGGPPVPAEACPRCGSPRDGQFCEGCGWNFADGTGPVAAPPSADPAATQYDLAPSAAGPQAPAVWSATVTADRAYYDAVREATGPDADGIDFPSYCPERRFRLTGSEVRVGRRSASRGIEPEIDLTGPPADPGVSRLHAVLIAGQDGTWSVLDPGSANGTLVNGSEIEPNEPVKLGEGDRVNFGAWTLLVVSRDN